MLVVEPVVVTLHPDGIGPLLIQAPEAESLLVQLLHQRDEIGRKLAVPALKPRSSEAESSVLLIHLFDLLRDLTVRGIARRKLELHVEIAKLSLDYQGMAAPEIDELPRILHMSGSQVVENGTNNLNQLADQARRLECPARHQMVVDPDQPAVWTVQVTGIQHWNLHVRLATEVTDWTAERIHRLE